jgi:hypothetical protein
MLQDKLLQAGKTIVIRGLPHTPAIGIADVVKVEFGMVHLSYRRNDHAESLELKVPRTDCEYFITHGLWTDPDDVPSKPIIPQREGEMVEGEVLGALDSLSCGLTELLANYSADSVKVHFDRGARLFWERVVKDAGS